MPNATNPLDLDAAEAHANAATPGPWTVELEQCDCSDGLCSHGTYVSAVYADGERRTEFSDFTDEDWRFTIHARTDVPALVAEIRRLRAELAATRTKTVVVEADEIVAHCPDHGTADGVWMVCHCAVADDMRRRAVEPATP
jgi:hypothetical protein